MNLFRIYLALALIGVGLILLFLHAFIWGDPIAGAATLAGCLLVAEIVRPSAEAVQAHGRKVEAHALEHGRDV